MPKVYLTQEERECQRFSDFIRGELKRQKKYQKDLADELNLTPGTITQKIYGKIPWTLKEIVQTMHYLDTSYTFGE